MLNKGTTLTTMEGEISNTELQRHLHSVHLNEDGWADSIYYKNHLVITVWVFSAGRQKTDHIVETPCRQLHVETRGNDMAPDCAIAAGLSHGQPFDLFTDAICPSWLSIKRSQGSCYLPAKFFSFFFPPLSLSCVSLWWFAPQGAFEEETDFHGDQTSSVLWSNWTLWHFHSLPLDLRLSNYRTHLCRFLVTFYKHCFVHYCTVLFEASHPIVQKGTR